MSIIRLSNITKKFHNITAIDHMNLTVSDGEYICILGQTGAGKTTLLRLIAGLLQPDQGEIYLEGRKVNKIPPEERNTVYMFQQFALFPHMTVWQNVSFGPVIKDWNQDRIDNFTSEILEMVRLNERKNAFPRELSGGMQQRVALARGIASGARILLLDEPFGALDARLKVDLRTQLRRLVKDQHLTAIHVTHNQEEALMIADRIVVLRAGRIEQIGKPEEIYSNPKSIFVTNFVGGANFLEGIVATKKGYESTILTRDGIKIKVLDNTKKIGEKVLLAIRLEDTIIKPQDFIGTNTYSCEITSKVFVGESFEYELKITGGTKVFSRMLLSNIYEKNEPGDNVSIFLDPNRFHIFSYPESGLLKEIEAI